MLSEIQVVGSHDYANKMCGGTDGNDKVSAYDKAESRAGDAGVVLML